MSDIIKQLEALKVIPVIAIENVDHTSRLADALVAGGLPCMEITLRTACALEAIKMASGRDDVCVGAGTVHSVEDAQRAVDAGATFIVSPGLNEKTVKWCLENDIPVFPGCVTPTELETALELGLEVVKFFPSEAYGGVKTLKALSGPYPEMRFIPTGGVNTENIAEYLALPCVLACGGTWMVNKQLIRDEAFKEITTITRNTMVQVSG